MSSFNESLGPIKKLMQEANSEDRQKMTSSLLNLIYSVEEDDDAVQRIGKLHLQTASIITGMELGVFKFLVDAAQPKSIQDIASNGGAEVELAIRILRHLAAIGAVDETSQGHYGANNYTKNLAQPIAEAGLKHEFYTVAPQYQALPTYLKETNYKNPVDPKYTAFNVGFKTDLDGFTWLGSNPQNLAYFNQYMALRRQPELTYLTVYPIAEEAAGLQDANRAVFVNMGGGIGHQCAQFKAKFPTIPGRVVLQDLPQCINFALPTDGVENLVHNIFEPQPIQGSKFYYLRNVLHDHTPDRVATILRHVKDVMAPDSVLLVDEIIMPTAGASSVTTGHDLTMLVALAGKERTEQQWKATFEEVGLKFCKTFVYDSAGYEAVMEVRLA